MLLKWPKDTICFPSYGGETRSKVSGSKPAEIVGIGEMCRELDFSVWFLNSHNVFWTFVPHFTGPENEKRPDNDKGFQLHLKLSKRRKPSHTLHSTETQCLILLNPQRCSGECWMKNAGSKNYIIIFSTASSLLEMDALTFMTWIRFMTWMRTEIWSMAVNRHLTLQKINFIGHCVHLKNHNTM